MVNLRGMYIFISDVVALPYDDYCSLFSLSPFFWHEDNQKSFKNKLVYGNFSYIFLKYMIFIE